jgi:alkanesulfonate monooxygenase SsuD/methylene tetrahydromethanopterin reductase-like flavin-dependent oxidoreductase (luciferase family)
MRDPHVELLLYSVFAERGTEYVDPEPLAFENALGRFQIKDGKLQIEPAVHFGDVDEAKAAVGPFLQAWEIETDLVANPGTIRFRFETAQVIDRDPPPPGSPITVQARGVSLGTAFGQACIRCLRHSYPPPPEAFRANDDVEIAFQHWRNYRDDKEGLLAMAYFVLTVLENPANAREKAASSPNG